MLAVPSRSLREVVAALPNGPVLSLTKGLDPATGEPALDAARRSPRRSLSGPTSPRDAADTASGGGVIASEDEELAERLQQELNSLIFRVYVNSDVVGVELAARRRT